MDSLFSEISHIIQNPSLPAADSFSDTIDNAVTALCAEDTSYRPQFKPERTSGGLLVFNDDVPSLIIPDLHARLGFLYSILVYSFPDGQTVYEKMKNGSLRVICLGDGLHSEKSAKMRWIAAYEAYEEGNSVNQYITEEMAQGLSLMSIIMKLKTAFPRYFHFLKGNHENILNEEGCGNHPFSKYAYEGFLSYEFFSSYYGTSLTASYALFEKKLPVFVIGPRFLASHAEPKRNYSKRELTAGQANHEVTLGLTWTDNGESRAGTVKKMLKKFLPAYPDAVYFGGHRPALSGPFDVRANGLFYQIHSRHHASAAYVPHDRTFNPAFDIIDIAVMEQKNHE